MRKVFLRVFAGLFAAAFMAASVSYAGKTEIVSKNSTGKLGNSNSDDPTISADGRYVAFSSTADNLVQGDTNGKSDIFVHDRQTGETKIISKDSNGKLGNNNSYVPAISADGRYVAFRSLAGNLVQGDTNGKSDIFVHDKQTGETIIISKDSSGKQGNNHSYDPAISADGRFVAFWSLASNLVPGDTNDKEDIFVHDRKTGETKIISKDSNGKPGNNFSRDPAISPNGRYVAFRSGASNLVPGDTNDKADIFVHDRQTGKTEIISKDSAGTQGTGPSSLPAISADGRFVAFESAANNLVPNDTNGETDAFVHDRQTGKTEIVSKDSTGIQGNGGRCFIPVISGDGRYVAFESDAGNLVPGDTNGKSDVFVRDRD